MNERSALQQRVLTLLQSSSCYRGDVCATMPCACAMTITDLLREAYCAGYWEWCGPANEAELERANTDEREGWERFTRGESK